MQSAGGAHLLVGVLDELPVEGGACGEDVGGGGGGVRERDVADEARAAAHGAEQELPKLRVELGLHVLAGLVPLSKMGAACVRRSTWISGV